MNSEARNDAEIRDAEQDVEQIDTQTGETPEGDGEEERREEERREQEPEQVQLLQKQLDEMRQEMERMRNQYLRLAADFENYRRRTRQEIEEIRRTAAERLLRELLVLADNFELAIAAVRSELSEKVITGIDMIYRQFLNILSQEGVEPIAAVGKPFDPTYHEAFEEVVTDEFPEGTVASEVRRGYLLRGKVLRPALVRVARSPQPKEQQNDVKTEENLEKKEDGENE
ncbi:MAG: nucleotide exchange factor GrpE [Thermacetogeniaceae bacterium]